MEHVLINGVRYIPEARRDLEFFVCFNRTGKPDYFVHETRQRLDALPGVQQVRVWYDDDGWQAELVA